MNEQRPSGTATVMFTDVEASTDVTTRLGDDAAASLLASHNKIVLDQVAAYGGRDVRSTGDGFLVVFDSARAAVSCALAIQRELTDREHAIRVRIGLNAGEVLEGGDELFGAAINLAARVMDRADGGEILTTDTVRQLVGTMTGASFRDRGRVALKGFAERQRLYEIRPADARPEPAAAPRRPPHRSRRTRTLLGTAILAAAIAGAVAIAHDPGSAKRRGAVSVPANSVAVIDPRTASVVGVIPTDENPGPVSAGAGGLWVLNLSSATLSRIDMRTRGVVETKGFAASLAEDGAPGNAMASADEVWVSAAGCNSIGTGRLFHVFSPGDHGLDQAGDDDVDLGGAVPQPRSQGAEELSNFGCGLAARGTSAWVATTVPSGIARVDYDPATGRSQVAWGQFLPGRSDAIAVGDGSVWAVDSQHQIIRRLDEKTGRPEVRLRAGSDPVAVATDAHAVWVANAGDGSVSRIAPSTNAVTDSISVGKGPTAVATGAGAVWVALGDAGSVARIDPRTDRVTATIAIGHRPQGIAIAGGMVWVTVRT